MQFDVKQTLAAALTLGMLIMLLNMFGSGPMSPSSPEETALMAAVDQEIAIEQHKKGAKSALHSLTPNKLWGKPGPVLQPCWNDHVTAREGRTWGFVSVVLSDGPHFHAFQVADAVIVARQLGATLLLPTIKEAPNEPNGDFDKLYDVNNFISSLKDVVRVVGRLPDDVRSMKPAMVEVPHKATQEYINEKVQPILKQNMIIQVTSVFSRSSLKDERSSDEEIEAIRCLVTYSSLRFQSQVQKLGERVISRVREAGESSGGHFVAVDLRVDVLRQKSCLKSGEMKKKKCFDAYDVAVFLKRLGFSSDTSIYITQSRWDQSLDPLREMFPNVHTKEYSMPFNEEKQILYSGNTQFEKAIDFYICTHSDVFIPAISGISYTAISGARIAIGKTQILIPIPAEDVASKLEVSKTLSKFITRKDHIVHSCLCKDAPDS